MRGRDSPEGPPLPANQNDAAVTFETIERNPWNAVERPLPEDADYCLLERAAFAAAECAKAASAAAKVAEVTDPDRSRPWRLRAIEAGERAEETWRRQDALPPEHSKVSPLIYAGRVQETAMGMVLAAMADERAPDGRPAVSAEAIERNRWSVLWSDLGGADPELLAHVRDTTLTLIHTALQHQENSHTSAEAALWKAYADAATDTYIAADCEARIAAARLPETQRDLDAAAPPVAQDRAALIDMLGEAAYRAINEPIPRGADRQTLEQLSGDLDVALEKLDALDRTAGAAGVSPQFIAAQLAKARDRSEELEGCPGWSEHVEREIDKVIDEANEELAREAPEIDGEATIYERYPDLTRDDEDPRSRALLSGILRRFGFIGRRSKVAGLAAARRAVWAVGFWLGRG